MRRLAKLTPEVDRAWEFAFAYYLQGGMTDEQADKAAWADMLLDFPRLREFDGAEAD